MYLLTCLGTPECGPSQHIEAHLPLKSALSVHQLRALWSGHISEQLKEKQRSQYLTICETICCFQCCYVICAGVIYLLQDSCCMNCCCPPLLPRSCYHPSESPHQPQSSPAADSLLFPLAAEHIRRECEKNQGRDDYKNYTLKKENRIETRIKRAATSHIVCFPVCHVLEEQNCE